MKQKTVLFMLLITIILVCISGQSTFSYLQDVTAPQSNTLQLAAVHITINEGSFVSDTIMLPANTPRAKTVSIVNEATAADGRIGTDAYIRVVLIPIWRNIDGGGSALPMNNVTLTLSSGAATDWLLGKDGFYYYKYPVPIGSSTTQLLSTVSWRLTGTSMDTEYTADKLEVQVLADSIQSLTNAVENYWGVLIDSGGNLVLTTANMQ